MRKIEIKTGQTIQLRTINGYITVSQHANSKYPTQVFFYVQNLDGTQTRTYEMPVTGLPRGMDIDVDETVAAVTESL